MATNIKTYPNLIDGTWKMSSFTPAVDFYSRTKTIDVNHE